MDGASRWLEGGCHCKRVRFRVRVPSASLTGAGPPLEALDCNCSVCRMKGLLHFIVTKDAFELVSGEEHLTTYSFNTGVAKHTFCRVCGVQAFYTPRSHPEGVDVNVRCLDSDAMGRFTIVPFDGERWEANIDRLR